MNDDFWTPWTVEPWGDGTANINDADCDPVAWDIKAEKAELIVAAVNAYAPQAAIIAELAAALERAEAALDGQPEYHDQGMGCGLEDRNIIDRYEAMAHGWESAMERVYSENVAWAQEEIRAALAKAKGAA